MDCDRKATASIQNRRQAWDTEPHRIQSRISDTSKRVIRPTTNRYSNGMEKRLRITHASTEAEWGMAYL
jgi:hypothetical protein